MARDGSGTYRYPAGIEGESGETIESEAYNSFLLDIQEEQNAVRPILNGGTGANTVAAARTNLGVMSSNGGEFTGNVTIKPPTGDAYLVVVKPASGQAANVYGQTNGSNRWIISLGNNVAETGGNAGSDFNIHRYNDTSGFLGTPLTINRTTGNITIPGVINHGGTLQTGSINMMLSGSSGNLTANAGTFASTLGVSGHTSASTVTASGAVKGEHVWNTAANGVYYFANNGGIYIQWRPDLSSFLNSHRWWEVLSANSVQAGSSLHAATSLHVGTGATIGNALNVGHSIHAGHYLYADLGYVFFNAAGSRYIRYNVTVPDGLDWIGYPLLHSGNWSSYISVPADTNSYGNTWQHAGDYEVPYDPANIYAPFGAHTMISGCSNGTAFGAIGFRWRYLQYYTPGGWATAGASS